ncbi:TolC family protein [Maribacter hydrothermalis]|uniref:Transporter n=1 Tax=Maribacter hydrothermalis TaxID=1836467 RepID=A0A1B7YZ31_9FLAO|nr:TolC family protein [Maribacter hydrothermalis]APQ16093.1 transporter [Maribacter hydrothermalis]OBR35729.1 transporter [Maribacter hydrothermalis]
MYRLLVLLVFILPSMAAAQQTISIDDCFKLVVENYPLTKQTILLNEQSRLDIEAINKGKLPMLGINAQATYQSDVTSLPIQLPNISVDPPNKDQYRATVDINQLLYNGGLINASSKVVKANNDIKQQEVNVSLYGLKNQINQLYLSVLLLQENNNLLAAKEEQLQTRLNEVIAGVKFGTLLPSSADALKVELIKIKQNFAELHYTKSGLLQKLSLLIGKQLNDDVNLIRPSVVNVVETKNQRPEITLFNLQTEKIEFSTELLKKSKLPKISAFAQGGYGNPGLNMLDNNFNTFYMTGLRLNWNAFDWKKNETEKQSLQINKDIIETEKETFELNTNLELANIASEIHKMEELISYDEAIIPVREKMVKSAESQLKNGVITSSIFITEFTNMHEAKSNLVLHKTQLLLKQIQYQITQGNYGSNNLN